MKFLDMNKAPDANGHFGVYGGRYVPETLMAALVELEREYDLAKADVLYLGERHTIVRHHEIQERILTDLGQKAIPLAIGLGLVLAVVLYGIGSAQAESTK